MLGRYWTTSYKTRTNIEVREQVFCVDGFHLLCQVCVLQMC